MSLLHGRTSGLSHIVNHSRYGLGISIKPEIEQKSVNNFFKRGKGDLQVELLERDNDYATFQVTMNSKTLDNPITTQIESRIDGTKAIDNPMETVNQSTSFFLDASNDIFNKSRGKLAELYPDYKKDLEGFDFTKMEAVAIKVQNQISNALTYGSEIANNMDKEEVKAPKAKKVKSLSLSM
jgi:hypothetical protein